MGSGHEAGGASSPGKVTLLLDHRTKPAAQTGRGVLLFLPAGLASVEVGGAAPGGRELHLLTADCQGAPGGRDFADRRQRIGPATADGSVDFLRENDRDFPTSSGPVPVVPARFEV